jgi:hypothetical protein
MKRSLHRLATIGVLSVLGPAFAVDVPRATAASVDAVRVIGQREFGPMIRHSRRYLIPRAILTRPLPLRCARQNNMSASS